MWINFFYLLCSVFALMQAIVEDDEKQISASLERGLNDYLETGEMTKTLNESLMLLQLPQYFRQVDEKGILSSTACVACKSSLSVLLFARRNGASRDTLKGLVEKLCSWLNIETEIVCSGAVGLNIDTLIYIVDEKPNLTSEDMCSIFLQEMNCGSSNYDWQINIPSWENYWNTRGLSDQRSKPLKILQLSDFHYDPGYQAGSNAACKNPLCCRIKSKPFTASDAAGFWGDYRNCDTPWHAFEEAIDHIVGQHKDIDYVYFTGDVINHLVWDTSVYSNVRALTKVYRHLRQKFNTTPIYYVLGNHETHPANQFAPIEITRAGLSTNWMYQLAVDQWDGLPKEAYETILKGGYYTTLVKPGFRIVALNSNVGYIFNWWLLYNDVDPYGQLQWLANILSEAERNRELVHILSHVPTNDEHCIKNWAKQYARILDRFSHIITAQFNGHTHFDDVIVYFNSTNPSQPINAAFNGGSLTTYNNLNPNYKIYTVDPINLEVIDAESWTYNITEANLQPKSKPRWYKLYSFSEAFYTQDLMPHSLESAVVLMAQNATLLTNYFRYKHRDANPAVLFGCNEECELKILCYIVTPHIDSLEKCEVVKAEYYRSRGKKRVQTR